MDVGQSTDARQREGRNAGCTAHLLGVDRGERVHAGGSEDVGRPSLMLLLPVVGLLGVLASGLPGRLRLRRLRLRVGLRLRRPRRLRGGRRRGLRHCHGRRLRLRGRLHCARIQLETARVCGAPMQQQRASLSTLCKSLSTFDRFCRFQDSPNAY